MRVCAATDIPSHRMIALVDNWDLSKMQVGSTDTSTLETPLPWNVAWRRSVEKQIEKDEHSNCTRQLKNDFNTSHVRNLRTNITFNTIKYTIVYLPLYRASYIHEGKPYHIMVNGQSGKLSGDRPYGWGSMGDAFGSIGKLFSSPQEPPRIVDGTALIKADAKQCYSPAGSYILLPSVRKGWIETRNLGNQRIELASLRRKNGRRLAMFELRPYQSQVFNFKDHRCIEILSGNPDNLQVVGFSYNSFSTVVDGEKANRLSMT